MTVSLPALHAVAVDDLLATWSPATPDPLALPAGAQLDDSALAYVRDAAALHPGFADVADRLARISNPRQILETVEVIARLRSLAGDQVERARDWLDQPFGPVSVLDTVAINPLAAAKKLRTLRPQPRPGLDSPPAVEHSEGRPCVPARSAGPGASGPSSAGPLRNGGPEAVGGGEPLGTAKPDDELTEEEITALLEIPGHSFRDRFARLVAASRRAIRLVFEQTGVLPSIPFEEDRVPVRRRAWLVAREEIEREMSQLRPVLRRRSEREVEL